MPSSSASSSTLATWFEVKGRGREVACGVSRRRWGQRGRTRSREGVEHGMRNNGETWDYDNLMILIYSNFAIHLSGLQILAKTTWDLKLTF
jgi:hypothetical protein